MTIKMWTGLLALLSFFGCYPVNAELRVKINIPSRTIQLLDYNAQSVPPTNKILHTYPAGVGRAQFPSPLGQFKIINMVADPAWQNPFKAASKNTTIAAGEGNPLGTRWMGFKATPHGEYGMHGTDRPQSVGKLASHGCIRLRIPDAEALFGQVHEGTPVAVTYDRVQLSTKTISLRQAQLWLTVYPDVYGLTAKGKAPAVLLQIQKQLLAIAPGTHFDPELIQKTVQLASGRPVLLGNYTPPRSKVLPLDPVAPFCERLPAG